MKLNATQFKTAEKIGTLENDSRVWTFDLLIQGHYLPKLGLLIVCTSVDWHHSGMIREVSDAVGRVTDGLASRQVFPCSDSGQAALRYAACFYAARNAAAEQLATLAGGHDLTWHDA